MFINLRQKSHYSLLTGLPQPEQIVARYKELGYPAASLTDFTSISGAIEFFKNCKKQEIKPILGCEVCTGRSQTQLDTVLLIAKNKTGWQNLIKIVSRSNDADCFYYRPTVPLQAIGTMSEGLIAILGNKTSETFYGLFNGEPRTYQQASSSLNPDHYHNVVKVINKYKEVFGDNLFIEIQLTDNMMLSMENMVAEIYRKAAKECGVKCVAMSNPHYLKAEDAHDHVTLLCSKMKKTMPQMTKLLKTSLKIENREFFESSAYHLPTQDLMKEIHDGNEEELDTAGFISSLVEDYNILGKPKLPHFHCPNDMDESQYLRKLCEDGMIKRLGHIKPEDIHTYKERLNKELAVFDEAKLAGYFLIVQDYVNWAKSQDYLIGPGRGSGGGCLTSYLLNITGIDPIPYDLLFERFYNSGRNTKDNISYPDIDVDFPVEAKEKVIQYIRDKYGKQNVCQLITFSRLLGASALKEVLRIHESCDFATMNEITRNLPTEASIMDKLEESKETSIIRWTLHNTPDVLDKYCRMNDDGSLVGDYALQFAQAIRLEGTYKASSKHAAGLIIASEPLENMCPMVRDKSSDEKLAGFEMSDLEAAGGIKFDILSVASLSKSQLAKDLLKGKR